VRATCGGAPVAAASYHTEAATARYERSCTTPQRTGTRASSTRCSSIPSLTPSGARAHRPAHVPALRLPPCVCACPPLTVGLSAHTRRSQLQSLLTSEDASGRTPLLCGAAAVSNALPTVQSLVSLKASIIAKDASRSTALHHAAGRGDEQLLSYLANQLDIVSAAARARHVSRSCVC
jgi:hypothetical protein